MKHGFYLTHANKLQSVVEALGNGAVISVWSPAYIR